MAHAYAEVANVQAEFKALDITTAGRSLTSTSVDDFITSAEAEVDSRISNQYVVPVTGPISVALLKQITIWLVKARILSILSVKTPQDKTKQDPDGPSLRKQALEALDGISKGTIPLVDATAATNAVGVESYNRDLCVKHDFTIERKEW